MKIKKKISFLWFFCYSLSQKNPVQNNTNDINDMNETAFNSEIEEKIKKLNKAKKRIFNKKTGFNFNYFKNYALFILILFLIFLIIKFYPKPEKDLIKRIQKLKKETKTRSLNDKMFKHINLEKYFEIHGPCFLYIGENVIHIFDQIVHRYWSLDKEFFFQSEAGKKPIFTPYHFNHSVINLIISLFADSNVSLKTKLHEIKSSFKTDIICSTDFLEFFSDVFFYYKNFRRKTKVSKKTVFDYDFFSRYFIFLWSCYSAKNRFENSTLSCIPDKNLIFHIEKNFIEKKKKLPEKLFSELLKRLSKRTMIMFYSNRIVIMTGEMTFIDNINLFFHMFEETKNPLIKYLIKIKKPPNKIFNKN